MKTKAFHLLSTVFAQLWDILPHSWTCLKTPRHFPRSQPFCACHVAVFSLTLHSQGTRGISQSDPMLFQIARALTMSLLGVNLYIHTLSSKLLLGVTTLFSGHFAQREIHSLAAPLPRRNAAPVSVKQSSERRGNKIKEGDLEMRKCIRTC